MFHWVGVEEGGVGGQFLGAGDIDKFDFADVVNVDPMIGAHVGDHQGLLSFEGELVVFVEDIELFFAIVEGDEGFDFNALGLGGEEQSQRRSR